jgi:hypothetical protein
MLPGCDGEELQQRCSLLLARDNATAGLRRCSDEAAAVLEHVQRLATTYAFASLPLAALKALRYQIVMLTAAAAGLEQFAYGVASNEEGADARG